MVPSIRYPKALWIVINQISGHPVTACEKRKDVGPIAKDERLVKYIPSFKLSPPKEED